jgi:putative SOS response-associated peptidase YedK
MCYYNGIKVSRVEYIRLVNLEKEIKAIAALLARPLQSGFEYKDWPIVRLQPDGCGIDIVAGHWEFIPAWLQTSGDVFESRKKFTTLNAIGEEMLEKRMFRDAALKRRCLVLSSGFYEWRHYKPEGAKKDIAYPYYITIKDREYFFMAGIWQPWTDRETGETLDTFAIVTTAANSLMAQVHNKKKRMPTILPDALALEWLQPNLSEERIKQLATFQLPTSEMSAYTISKDFRANGDPEASFTFSELPAII